MHNAAPPSARVRARLCRVGRLALLAALAGLAGCGTVPSAAPAPPPTTGVSPLPAGSSEVAPPAGFADWVAAFRAQALDAGITEATLQAAFDGVHFLPRVVERDRSQPEFTRAVWDYLDSALSAQRVATGRDRLQQYRAEAEATERQYGVPASIVVAIWGLESNYGGNTGRTPTIDALATLGFEGRREAWARGQLLAALKIVQQGDIDAARMVGSWAGAMGQTQFLPSSFLAYAVDADGDGRRDIWGSTADVMASTANLLARAGWQAGQPWGLEVALPAGFDPGRADERVLQPAAAWAAEGVTGVDGAPLPDLADSSILLPAGATGPAFLVGPNFSTLLRYNHSTSYALAVGLLAQQMDGGPGVRAPWPRTRPSLSRSQLQALQAALNALGFDCGTADGLMGPATRDGIRRYQRSLGLAADGYPDASLLQRLQAP